MTSTWAAIVVLRIATASGIGDWHLDDTLGPYETRKECLARVTELQDAAILRVKRNGGRVMGRYGDCRRIMGVS